MTAKTPFEPRVNDAVIQRPLVAFEGSIVADAIRQLWRAVDVSVH